MRRVFHDSRRHVYDFACITRASARTGLGDDVRVRRWVVRAVIELSRVVKVRPGARDRGTVCRRCPWVTVLVDCAAARDEAEITRRTGDERVTVRRDDDGGTDAAAETQAVAVAPQPRVCAEALDEASILALERRDVRAVLKLHARECEQ